MRSVRALLLGLGWLLTLNGLGLWLTVAHDAAILWGLLAPWSAPGALLAVWGARRTPGIARSN